MITILRIWAQGLCVGLFASSAAASEGRAQAAFILLTLWALVLTTIDFIGLHKAED